MANKGQDSSNASHGFDIKTFLIAVLVGVIVILVTLYWFVAARGTKDVPKASQPHPNAQVTTGFSGNLA